MKVSICQAVVIAVSSAIRRVITNDQRLIEFAISYISSTFLKILAVPNKAAFCITPTLHVIPNFSTQLSNSLVIHPRAPITIGTTSTRLSFHNHAISLFKYWYFSTFPFSFSPTCTSAGTAISMINPLCSFLSTIIISGLLASITLSH